MDRKRAIFVNGLLDASSHYCFQKSRKSKEAEYTFDTYKINTYQTTYTVFRSKGVIWNVYYLARKFIDTRFGI